MDGLPAEVFLQVCENLDERSLVWLGVVSKQLSAGLVDVLRRLARKVVSCGAGLSPALASWFWHHPDGKWIGERGESRVMF